MLYNRLSTLKEIARKQATSNPPSQLINPLAVELGLNDVGGPSPLLMEGSNPPAHFYEHLLDLCEKLFDNEIDQLAFEENMRHMYGTKAFVSFTLDKLIAGIVKQVSKLPLKWRRKEGGREEEQGRTSKADLLDASFLRTRFPRSKSS